MKKLFFIFISLCFISSTIFAQDNEKLKLKVEKMNKTLVAAMLANDTETLMSMYTDDIISLPSYQPTVKGIAKLRELSEMQAKSGWKTTSFVLDITDMIFSGNLVIEIGT
jgi:ketosteroid isomerase-like protein